MAPAAPAKGTFQRVSIDLEGQSALQAIAATPARRAIDEHERTSSCAGPVNQPRHKRLLQPVCLQTHLELQPTLRMRHKRTSQHKACLQQLPRVHRPCHEGRTSACGAGSRAAPAAAGSCAAGQARSCQWTQGTCSSSGLRGCTLKKKKKKTWGPRQRTALAAGPKNTTPTH